MQYGALTLAGIALSDQAHHQRGAVRALSWTGEGLDAQLVSFRLWRHILDDKNALQV